MSRRKPRRLMNQINVVPYIDVTLVLLVIFMVTAPLTNPGVVELPSVGQALKQPSAPLVVVLKANKTIEIDGKKVQRDELLSKIRQQIAKDPERSVVISGDKNLRYEDVVTVMDMLNSNKVKKVGLLAKPVSN